MIWLNLVELSKLPQFSQILDQVAMLFGCFYVEMYIHISVCYLVLFPVLHPTAIVAVQVVHTVSGDSSCGGELETMKAVLYL